MKIHNLPPANPLDAGQLPSKETGKAQTAAGSFAQQFQGALDAASARRLDARLDAVQRKAASAETEGSAQSANLERQKKQLWQASQELEAIFLQQMLSAMQRTVPRDQGILKMSQAEEVFQGLLDEELAKVMAETGEMGLAKALYDQLVQSLGEKEKAKKPGAGV